MLAHERSSRRRNFELCGRGGDLYQYLWERIATRALDQLDFKTWRVVTFNYGRSLLAYLYDAMLNTYDDVDARTVIGKLRELEIVHVYGSLGSFFPADAEHQEFGPEQILPGHIGRAAKNLRVIPQSRNTDECIERARQLLIEADRIAVLGFGFDEMNLERLDASRTMAMHVPRDAGQSHVRWIATSCLGMTDKAARAIAGAWDR
jgi:hypothetical protein